MKASRQPATGRRQPAISVAQLAKQACRELEAAGDPRRAARMRGYFKPDEDVRSYGVEARVLREMARGWSGQARGVWGLPEAVDFCDRMLRRRELEAKAAGILLLGSYRRAFDASLLPRIEQWLEAGRCGDWASTDTLCGEVLRHLIARAPEVVPTLIEWTGRRSLWVRRASAVPLTYFARRGQHLDAAYEIATRLLPAPEDLLHKAAGWLLREAGRSDLDRLEQFLLRHRSRIPRTTVRYALEKFPSARRKTLLAQTKADN